MTTDAKVPTHLYGFKAQFVPLILSGAKQQTIRAERKRMPDVGHRMRLQHGSRFKPQLMGFAKVLDVHAVRIDVDAETVEMIGPPPLLGFTLRDASWLDDFARRDGFPDWAAMRAFWKANHPTTPQFSGFLTYWGETFERHG